MDMEENSAKPKSSQPAAAAIKEAMAERGLSQAEVARQADVSPTTLSQFLSGSYRGDNEEIARKLTAWLDSLKSGDGLSEIIARVSTFTDTLPTTQRILGAAQLAKNAGLIVYVAGSSGVGKTEALKHFAKAVPAVWYCEFSKDTKSVYATLVEVAFAVGISQPALRPDHLRRDIVARIARTRGLLICDEAQNLSQNGFEEIRTLHDRSGVGVVFAGHLDLADKIASLPQLGGRAFAPVRIGSAKPADVDALLTSWGMNCKRTRDFLRPFARQSTGLRRIANAYKLAALYAAGKNEDVAFEHIQRAWNDLAGSIEAA